MQNILTNNVKKITYSLMGIGLLLILISFFIGNKDIHNYPWTSIYTALIFFTFLSTGALFFLSIQYATQTGWSVILLRIMESISSFIPIGGGLIILFLILSSLHLNHIFHWMDTSLYDKTSVNYDSIIDGKKAFLNLPFFFIRALIYIIGWSFFYYLIKKKGEALENIKDDKTLKTKYFSIRNTSAVFLVFFAITSSLMAWDWIMSIDTHWFSTLFGWYVLAGMIVSSIIAISLITIYVNKKGHLPQLKKSHVHDLSKFIFGFSMFWTYLWFSQFLLIWYSNIPEEVTYFLARYENYKIFLFLTLGLNFLLPFFSIIDSDAKKNYTLMTIIGILILIGHFCNIFMMIQPGSSGENWTFGIAEIGSILFFGGIFIHRIFYILSKKNIIIEGHPMLDESKHFSYYNIEDTTKH